jgi:hypothetical protein
MKPMLKPPGIQHLKLNCDLLLSTFAFKFYLCRYTRASHQQPQNPSMVGPNGMVLPPGGGGGGGGFGSDIPIPGQVASPPMKVNARATAPAPVPTGGVTQILPAASSTPDPRRACCILVH